MLKINKEMLHWKLHANKIVNLDDKQKLPEKK